jgi:CheY-like chemotaxis protein
MMERTVLIVEDAETCSSILEIIFSSIRDLKVVTASSGDQAWEILENEHEPVRAIVTDLHMPGMDGFELMGRVRAHRVHQGVPIIVITGCTDVDAPEQARLRGANAVFLKPYSPSRVREKLEQLLSDETPRG